MAASPGRAGEPVDLADLLGREIRRRRRALRISQAELARRIHFGRDYVSKAENGRSLPSTNLVAALDAALDAGDALVRLREEAEREQAAQRLAVRYRHTLGEPCTEDAEEDETDRRDLLRLGGIAVGSIVVRAASAAAGVSRRLAVSAPDPMAVEDVEHFARVYPSTPHAELFPLVWQDWLRVERLLDGRPRLTDRAHLTLLAGQLTYFLARLSFNMGGELSARKQTVLAWQYAEDVGQPVLCSSVAMLRSTFAFYGGQPRRALDLLDVADAYDDPYTRARVEAYRSRCHAALGDDRSARAALARMDHAVIDVPAQPGEHPFTASCAALFRGGVLTRLGDGAAAEPYARAALAGCDGPAGLSLEERGHARLAVAAALVLRPRPEPEEAARVGMQAIDVGKPQRSETVFLRAREVGGMLVRYESLSSVRSFIEMLRTVARPAAPAAS